MAEKTTEARIGEILKRLAASEKKNAELEAQISKELKSRVKREIPKQMSRMERKQLLAKRNSEVVKQTRIFNDLETVKNELMENPNLTKFSIPITKDVLDLCNDGVIRTQKRLDALAAELKRGSKKLGGEKEYEFLTDSLEKAKAIYEILKKFAGNKAGEK
jgi:hypothetical protein